MLASETETIQSFYTYSRGWVSAILHRWRSALKRVQPRSTHTHSEWPMLGEFTLANHFLYDHLVAKVFGQSPFLVLVQWLANPPMADRRPFTFGRRSAFYFWVAISVCNISKMWLWAPELLLKGSWNLEIWEPLPFKSKAIVKFLIKIFIGTKEQRSLIGMLASCGTAQTAMRQMKHYTRERWLTADFLKKTSIVSQLKDTYVHPYFSIIGSKSIHRMGFVDLCEWLGSEAVFIISLANWAAAARFFMRCINRN